MFIGRTNLWHRDAEIKKEDKENPRNGERKSGCQEIRKR
jgi:hypothetical protein